jgi:hypothetical protein
MLVDGAVVVVVENIATHLSREGGLAYLRNPQSRGIGGLRRSTG